MSDIRLGCIVVSSYTKPRPDRVEAGARLADELKTYWPTVHVKEALPIWPAMRYAWRVGLFAPFTHALVIQDDVHLTPGFEVNVQAALEAQPNEVVSLCNFRNAKAQKALDGGARWIATNAACTGQAIIAPAPIIREWLPWCACYVSADYVHDDGRWSLWAYVNGRRIWHTVPSLVTHDTDLPSAMGHPNHWNHADVVATGPIQDWSADLVILDNLAGFGSASRRELEAIRDRMEAVR